MKNLKKIGYACSLVLLFCNCDKKWSCPEANVKTDFNGWMPDYKKGVTIVYEDSLGNAKPLQVYDDDHTPPTSGSFNATEEKNGCRLSATSAILAGDTVFIIYQAFEEGGTTRMMGYSLDNKKYTHPLYNELHIAPVSEYTYYDSLTLLKKQFTGIYKLSQPADTSRFPQVIYVGKEKGIVAYNKDGVLFVLRY